MRAAAPDRIQGSSVTHKRARIHAGSTSDARQMHGMPRCHPLMVIQRPVRVGLNARREPNPDFPGVLLGQATPFPRCSNSEFERVAECAQPA